MKRTVKVSRTAHDLDHLNRVRAPHFGVLSLFLQAKGKQQSKTYFPEWAPKPAAAGGGDDDFHFVPEKEVLDIAYELDNPFAMVDAAKLELFCRFQEKPLWTVDLAELGEDALLHGKHKLQWDGRVCKLAAQASKDSGGAVGHDLTKFDADTGWFSSFSDGYVTLEHTPYKLKLTLSARDDAAQIAVAWTYFHIIVKSLLIELGPEEAVASPGYFKSARHEMDLQVYRALKAAGGMPAAGAATPQRVVLASNLFKYANWFSDDSGEMADETAHDVYKKLWDDGPRIPVIAKIRLAASDDAEVKLEDGPGAKALGQTRFLWDWEDVNENVASVQSQPKPQAFISDAIDYHKTTTAPQGDNCHVDRGGKRGPSAEPVFPNQDGYDPQAALKASEFPFKVEACATRKWAVYSHAWSSGKLIGCTGVLFQPSRMAGDSYRLGVYAACDKTADDKWMLDVLDKDLKPLAPAAMLQQTGVLQVWREIHLVAYVRKSAAVPDFLGPQLPKVLPPYAEAYTAVDNRIAPAVGTLLLLPGYNAKAEEALKKSGKAVFTEMLFVDAGADHAATSSQFATNDFATFKVRLAAWHAAQGLPPGSDGAWLAAKGMTGPGGEKEYMTAIYHALLGNDGAAISHLLNHLDLLKGAKPGVTIIHFNYVHSAMAALIAAGGNPGLILNGMAVNVPGSTRDTCCFALWKNAADTFVHEIGHQMFLPHGKYTTVGGTPPNFQQPLRHDDTDNKCMMSYDRPRVSFCGLCQLRLRGWDAGENSASAKLKSVPGTNHAP